MPADDPSDASAALPGVYLRPLPDDLVPARYSVGAGRRAGQLQRFLQPLQASALPVLQPQGPVTLLVANRQDWRRLCSYPYGLPFTRTAPRNASVTIMVAADYQPRLLRRFDDLLLTAAREGARAPAQIGEFLDLMVGHEWGHAAANLSGLRTRVKWLDELIASYLFVQALHATGQTELLARLTAWVQVQLAGTRHAAGDLATFEYPRSRAGWGKLLWYQGVFTERALELAPLRGWDFPLELRSALPAAHRGELARSLIQVEPSFKPWFAVFGR